MKKPASRKSSNVSILSTGALERVVGGDAREAGSGIISPRDSASGLPTGVVVPHDIMHGLPRVS